MTHIYVNIIYSIIILIPIIGNILTLCKYLNYYDKIIQTTYSNNFYNLKYVYSMKQKKAIYGECIVCCQFRENELFKIKY